MLYGEKIGVCSQARTKHMNTLGGQNVEFFYIRPGGTKSNHGALNG
jgi:hypothetical protein